MLRDLVLVICALSSTASARATSLRPIDGGDISFQTFVEEHQQKQLVARVGSNSTNAEGHPFISGAACESHDHCGDSAYCHAAYSSGGVNYNSCASCPWCYWDEDSITGSCPTQCSYAASCVSLKPFAYDNDHDDDDDDVGSLIEYDGSCGAFEIRKSNRWCASRGHNTPATCWALSPKDCCKTNGGAIAGLVVGLMFGIALIDALIVTLLPRCCACRIFQKHVLVVGQQQSVPLQIPQVVIDPNALK